MKNFNVSAFLAGARKFLIALTAALAVLAAALSTGNGVDGSEWVQVALAFLGAAGVYIIPNQETK